MVRTAVVMDSTGYLTPDILTKCQIHIIPLTVTIDAQTYPETDLSNTDFLAKIAATSVLSVTSQPSVGAFLELYEGLFAAGYQEIVSIHLSQKISGTVRSAEMAKSMASRPDIHVFDSGSAALGLGLLAWTAGEWALDGASGGEIIKRLVILREQTRLFFIVDSLENLRLGCRIGGAAALLGTLLQIKPILHFNTEYEIDVFDKVRSKGRAWQKVLEELEETARGGGLYRICVQHVNIPAEGERLLAEVKERFPGHDVRLFEAGPVIATHVGSGAFGLAFQPLQYNIQQA